MARRRLLLELVICPERSAEEREKNRAALHERFKLYAKALVAALPVAK
jgi:hypothetical protein